MHRSSGAKAASSDKNEFLNQCRDIKNTLVGLLESQKEFRREMMDYSARVNSGSSDESDVEEEEVSYEEDESSSEEETESDDDEVVEEGASRVKPEVKRKSSVADPPNSETLSIWKCAVCGKQIKGNWHKRQNHIGFHEGLKVSCPVAGCFVRFFNLSRHLKMHKLARNDLPSSEKAALQRMLDGIEEAAMNCELKYFPPTSFISFSETVGKDGVRPFCKKCGRRCTQLVSRRDHVAKELNLKMDCPVRGCPYGGRNSAVSRHLKQNHGKNLQGLNRAEKERFDSARQKLHKKVDPVMHKFFS
uniref:C2H2-type domain-containing protein n=1 Tax=Steinernema glaseri TaxID=37863 RepID=A0A1I7Y0A1_9BILA